MEIYKILEEIMKERNLTVANVAKICGIPDSTIRGLIKRRQETTALNVAFKLSYGLNVSLERLNGLPEKTTTTTPIYSDPQINTLIESAKQLDLKGLSKLNDYADDLVSSGKYRKNKGKEQAM